jgi:hypothetical protein
MSRREELMRRCDAAMTAAAEKAESIAEWSDETRMAVAMTIRLLGREFSQTLQLALASANEEIDPVSPARLAEVERDWNLFVR